MVAHFHHFSSIENSREKNIKSMEKSGHTDSLNEWVALEKIHGANFSFYLDGMEKTGSDVLVAKRSSFIEPDESFYNHQVISNKYSDDMLIIYTRVQDLIQPKENEKMTVQVYGEIFGGYYPGIKSSRDTKCVQKGICYSPENEFLIFDVRVDLVDLVKVSEEVEKQIDMESFFLSQSEIESVGKDLKVKLVPVSYRGSFDEMIKLNPIFESQIYKIFNLPLVPKNLAEGWVIKKNTRHVCRIPRPILKMKNEENFGEISGPPKDKVDPSTLTDFTTDIMRFVTKNRFDAVISKIGVENPKAKIQGLYVADVLKDYLEELPAEKVEAFHMCQKEIKININQKINQKINEESMIDNWLNEIIKPMC